MVLVRPVIQFYIVYVFIEFRRTCMKRQTILLGTYLEAARRFRCPIRSVGRILFVMVLPNMNLTRHQNGKLML